MATSTRALLLLLAVPTGAQPLAGPVEVLALPAELLERDGEPALLRKRPQDASWSSSQSSSSSWERGADGRMHQRVREVQEQVSGDGRRKKAAIACLDGHCKGVVAGPDRRSAALAGRVSRGGRDSDTTGLAMHDIDGSFAREDAVFGNMRHGMQSEMQDVMSPMEQMMQPLDQMMRPAEQTTRAAREMQDVMSPMERMMQPLDQMMPPAEQTMRTADASLTGILRRGRGAAAAKQSSESSSYSYSSNGDQAVVQAVECHEGKCVQATKRYGGAGLAAGAKEQSSAKPAPPAAKTEVPAKKDVPYVEILQEA